MTFLLSVITGIGAGFGVSAGVFALVTSLSLLPRMADKTHTGYAMRTYETWVFWGGMFGNSIYFFQQYDLSLSFRSFYPLPLILFGSFAGIAIGTLAVSIAESLNVTAVLGRSARLHYGLGVLILCFAVGKALGSLLFFYKHWF